MLTTTQRQVQAHGTSTHLYLVGQGPPVVLLHGLGGAAVSWVGTMELLAERFTVIAPDLPGHGQSERPPWDYAVEHGPRWVTNLLDALEIPQASLVGNSLGGFIAATTALSHPTRVHRLVLVDSVGLGKEIAPFLRLLSLPLVGELVGRPSRRGLRALLRRLLYDPAVVSPSLFEALQRERARASNLSTWLRILRVGVWLGGVKPSIILLEQLPHLTAPTLLVWGEQDRVFPVQQAHRALRLLPNATLHVFPECGHWPHVERHQRFTRLVTDFLSQDT